MQEMMNSGTSLVPSAPASLPPVWLNNRIAPPDEITAKDLWRILLKRRWTILAVMAAAALAALSYALLVAPKYEAIARIEVGANSDVLGVSESSVPHLQPLDTATNVETQVKILESDSLALQVLSSLRLNSNPAFVGRNIARKSPDITDLATRTLMLGTFRKALKVKAVAKTNLIEIRFRSRSPQLSADVVNELVSACIERGFKVKYEATAQASAWLSQQLEGLKQSVEKSQAALAEFQQKNGLLLLGADETKNTIIAKVDDLNAKLVDSEAERITKEAMYRIVQSGNPELITTIAPNSTLQVLRAQEADLKNQYAQATAKYGDAYPRVVQLRVQLDQLSAAIQQELTNISTRISNDYQAAKQTEDMVQAALEREKNKAYKMNQGALHYMIMKREADASRDLYQGLVQKLKEAGIVAGLHSTSITVVDKGQVPASPVEPNLPLDLGLGLAGGLMLGVISAFLLENADSALRTIEEVEVFCGLPSLAIIPNARLMGKHATRILRAGATPPVALIALTRPRSQISESFRVLRSSLMLSAAQKPPQAIVITSALPQEGKTTVALNTAIVLAQSGSRVLLVDADMRRASIHQRLSLDSAAPGLTSLLARADGCENAIVSWPDLPNLSVLPAGQRAPYPAELLGSARMTELLAQWREQFDHVVFDTPPALSVTDAVVLGAKADTVLLVLRWGATARQAIRRARDQFLRTGARIGGVVINRVDFSSAEHYYHHGKKSYDHYYDDREAGQLTGGHV